MDFYKQFNLPVGKFTVPFAKKVTQPSVGLRFAFCFVEAIHVSSYLPFVLGLSSPYFGMLAFTLIVLRPLVLQIRHLLIFRLVCISVLAYLSCCWVLWFAMARRTVF